MRFEHDRRTFLKAMGGAGLATLTGCGEEPTKRLVSYLNPPENIVPGVPTWYASVCRECPAGCGIVVATREGRPIKIEGNPLHPINKGALCARGQAALQGLYNPDRVTRPLKRSDEGDRSLEEVSWDEALGSLSETLRSLKSSDSLHSVAMVTSRLSGALASLLKTWTDDYPGLSVYEHEAVSYEAIEKANEICFGRSVLPLYKIDSADLVVSFGADFMDTWISPVEYARDFASMRAYRDGEIGRLVYVGSRHCLTAANADEMVLINPGTYGALALGIAKILLEVGQGHIPSSTVDAAALKSLVGRYDLETVYHITGVPEDTVRHLARVLAQARRSLALPGGIELDGSNATQNLVAVNILNYVLANYGETIELPARNSAPSGTGARDFSGLIDRMQQGRLRLLILYDVNPVYSLPPSSGFLEALKKVDTVVCCSDVFNETTAVGTYVLPIHSPLESWGDYVPRDGVYGLMQPAVRPLSDSKHFADVLIELSRLSGEESSTLSGYESYSDFLLDHWKDVARAAGEDEAFQDFWEKALRRGGYFRQPELPPVELSREALAMDFREPLLAGAQQGDPSGFQGGTPRTEHATLLVYPSLVHYDGRGANRPWLQELAGPVLQNVWGTVVEVSRGVARRMELDTGDILRVTSRYGELECPAYVAELAHGDVVAIAMGQGHRAYGRFAEGIGANPLELLPFSFDDLSGATSYLRVRVQLERTGRAETIPTPQGHSYDEGRGIVQSVSLSSLRRVPKEQQQEPPEREHEFRDLFAPHEHPKHRWGMTIDLNACIGCSACVIACQAENNVPVVGKKLYLEGREMAWIRIERYFDRAHPGRAQFIPMLCQQCDYAPCEPVCPVFATYHSKEGLNAQIYNRCVGTRYCANNCPYNVRRFNWFTLRFADPLHLQLHPDVTVREKGVMEKCSFCIQRIFFAEDRAKDEAREVRDGEIVPACAQTCPSKAITFG
ncbi:MAG: molybdopterin-dependent oxidoreductase, partial [Acidobacteriota bacterium]